MTCLFWLCVFKALHQWLRCAESCAIIHLVVSLSSLGFASTNSAILVGDLRVCAAILHVFLVYVAAAMHMVRL